jgi:hypothetical protein
MSIKRWNGLTDRLRGATNIPHDNASISADEVTTDEVALYRMVRIKVSRHFPNIELRRHLLVLKGQMDCCKTSNKLLARKPSMRRRNRGTG